MRSTPMVVVVLVLVSSSSLAQRPLSVYVSADMEGVAGLSSTDDAAGRRLMTREVNAAIAGAFAAGAGRVVVNDAHGSHDNLIQEELDPRATLIRGDLKPYGMMEGLDASFDAVLFVGFHAKAGTTDAFAAHTGSGRVVDLRINGTSVGEAGMNALYAGWHLVPVVFMSGDSLAIEELRALTGALHGVPVKRGIWGRAAYSLSPDSAGAAIRRGVEAALRMRDSPPIPRADDYTVELEYSSAIFAEVAEGIPGVERAGPRTVRFRTQEYPDAYRMIRVLYKHLGP